MALKKEQTFFLACLALGAWAYRSGSDDAWNAPRVAAGQKEHQQAVLPSAPLLTGPAVAPPLRRFFREPSETQPLPPRQLPFPEREPMAFVALPLPIGPDLVRADLLRISGLIVAGALPGGVGAEQGQAEVEADAGADAQQPAPVGRQTREQKKERYRRQYDQVWITGQNEEHFGILRAPGHDLFELEQRDAGGLEDVVVHVLEFSLSEEKIKPPEATFGADDRLRVVRIRLADNLRNTVARAVRAVPPDAAHALDRERLIDQLLLWAREEGWVFDVALEQAEILTKTSPGAAALRAKARVLRLRGDLAGELALYESLPESGPLGGFRFEGLGTLQSRLGLAAAAEQSLRQAVSLMPTDARPHAALANFLREQGRPLEAFEQSRAAVDRIGSVTDLLERVRIVQVAVGGLLGMGDVDAARDALSRVGPLPAGGQAAAFTALLRASIDYAAGEVAAAQEGFRAAAAAGQGQQAQLGQLGLAACQLRLESWAEAKAGFLAVADDAPLLRHVALAGLSLLSLRVGAMDEAAADADRALDANPQYAYAHYLKAKALAATGQYGAALDSLSQALKLRDDFVPALQEVAELRLRLCADGDAAERAENALAAARYADRAVELSARDLTELRQTQGLAHFAAADLRRSRDAFRAARDAAATDDQRLFAQAALCVVDYAQDRADDARPALERMQADLPREQPMRQWATQTLARIDDHAQKEQFDDRFERSEIGNVWRLDRDGGLSAVVEDHRLLFRGRFSRTGEVSATRLGAVSRGGKFLAASARMETLSGHQAMDSFVGLRIQSRSSGGAADFAAQVGLRDGKPYFLVREGKQDPTQSPPGSGAVSSGPHTVELRVLDRGENLFRLLCIMDGEVLHEQDLTLLRASDQKELETTLLVSGRSGANVAAAFDDYHLERRKD